MYASTLRKLEVADLRSHNKVWDTKGQNFVRVLHEGTVVQGFEWMPLDNFIALINSQIIPGLLAACNASS